MLNYEDICEVCRSTQEDNDEICNAHEIAEPGDCDIFDYLKAVAQAQEQATCREVAKLFNLPCTQHLLGKRIGWLKGNCGRCREDLLEKLANGEMPKENY